jgi:hypothetical protein
MKAVAQVLYVYTGVEQTDGSTTDTDIVFDHLLPSEQLQSFFEWTRTSFGQSLTEFYTHSS